MHSLENINSEAENKYWYSNVSKTMQIVTGAKK